MKRLLFVFSVALLLSACGNSNQGELVGVRKTNKTFNQPDPYGMVFVPQGSYTMGVGGEDITASYMNEPKTVSVPAFLWMKPKSPTTSTVSSFTGSETLSQDNCLPKVSLTGTPSPKAKVVKCTIRQG